MNKGKSNVSQYRSDNGKSQKSFKDKFKEQQADPPKPLKKPKKKKKGESEEEEYYDENSEESASLDTIEAEEEEYLDFLMEFGHIDFSLISFLPKIKSVDELIQLRRDEQLNSTKYIKVKALIDNNPDYGKGSPRRSTKGKTGYYESRKKKKNNLTLIQEQPSKEDSQV